MNTLIMLLAVTKGEATFEIISMLFGAAIIGYLTAWIYSKSVFDKKIELIESDKHELNNRIVNLDGTIVDLHKTISEKDIEIEKLILAHISQHKHLLDYKSFGTATEAEKDDLKMISGI